MPLPQPKTFTCPKCGHKKIVILPDAITPADFPICSKCKAKMELKG